MSTKEEFEKLNHFLDSCLGSVRCGVDLSEIEPWFLANIRRKCEALSEDLVLYE